jgi:hypothetical protein
VGAASRSPDWLLRLAQGRTDAAAAAIGRAVTETTDRLRRVKLLPAQVEIMLAAEVEAARDAAAELIQMAGAYSTPALRAMATTPAGRCCWPMATPPAMERDAAHTMFAELGAAPDLVRVEALARRAPSRMPMG